MVFEGGVLIAGCPAPRFSPMLEMLPLLGKTAWDRGVPLGAEAIRGVETDGELWVGGA